MGGRPRRVLTRGRGETQGPRATGEKACVPGVKGMRVEPPALKSACRWGGGIDGRGALKFAPRDPIEVKSRVVV